MSENAILYLVYRMGYKGKMTGHGWRGVASTWANEGEYNSDHIEMQLSHDEDDDSRAAYNSAQDLSQRRAGAVADQLRAAGVPSRRIVAIGRGEDFPIASNLTPEGRALNRRVEIVIRPTT